MAVLSIGDQFPAYELTAVVPGNLKEVEASKPRDCEVVGVSVDNEYTHYAWRRSHDKLQDLPFPMASDLNRELTEALGIKRATGEADRATFIIDPHNVIQSVSVTADSVGRNTEEVLRQLDALQSDELCACNWQAGAATIDALGQMG